MFLALAHMVGATQVMGLGWGGVGMITFFELAHVVGATQVMGWGGVGVGWGGDDNVLWTCTHGRCYASHGMGWGGVGMITFFWTCTHGRCYASHGMGWGGVGMITFFELAHMVGATQVMGWGMLSRVWTFPEMFVDVYVSKNLYFSFIYICTINGFLLPKIPHSWFLKTETAKNRHKRLDCQTLQFVFMFKFTAPASELWHYLQKYCGPQHFWTLGTS